MSRFLDFDPGEVRICPISRTLQATYSHVLVLRPFVRRGLIWKVLREEESGFISYINEKLLVFRIAPLTARCQKPSEKPGISAESMLFLNLLALLGLLLGVFASDTFAGTIVSAALALLRAVVEILVEIEEVLAVIFSEVEEEVEVDLVGVGAGYIWN